MMRTTRRVVQCLVLVLCVSCRCVWAQTSSMSADMDMAGSGLVNSINPSITVLMSSIDTLNTGPTESVNVDEDEEETVNESVTAVATPVSSTTVAVSVTESVTSTLDISMTTVTVISETSILTMLTTLTTSSAASSPMTSITAAISSESSLITAASSDLLAPLQTQANTTAMLSITTVPTVVVASPTPETTSSMLPTTPETTPSVACDIGCRILSFFDSGGSTAIIVVAIGGFFILVLLSVIFFLCTFCCYKSCKKRRQQHWLNRMQTNGEVHNSHYRPSISLPMRQPGSVWQSERDRLEQIKIAETMLGRDQVVENGYHLTGASQMQASQAGYSQSYDMSSGLPMLTPMNPSQLIRQAHGQISVDDELPERDPHSRVSLSIDDSPFLHMTNNLSGSTSSRLKLNSRSVDSPPNLEPPTSKSQTAEINEASQYSYLGLGVHHGSDLIFTNTASLMEDELGGIGLVGLDRGAAGKRRHSQQDEQLDETPVLMTKEESAELKRSSLGEHQFADAEDRPERDSGPPDSPLQAEPQSPSSVSTSTAASYLEGRPRADTEGSKRPVKKISLSAMTSLSSEPSRFSSREHLVSSDHDSGDLQEKPERHRVDTAPAAALNPNFKRGGGKGMSKLGKLTSLEYIRNSLRKMRRKSSNGREANDRRKKHLKPALKQTGNMSTGNLSDKVSQQPLHNHYTVSSTGAHGYRDRAMTAPTHGPHGFPGSPNQFTSPVPAGYPMDGYQYPSSDQYGAGNRFPNELSQGYPELSPILSVPYDYHEVVPPDMIGLAPPYVLSDTGYLDSAYPLHPQYNDLSPDNYPELDSAYRHTDVGPSQRSVRWNLELEEIPRSPVELTPTDLT